VAPTWTDKLASLILRNAGGNILRNGGGRVLRNDTVVVEEEPITRGSARRRKQRVLLQPRVIQVFVPIRIKSRLAVPQFVKIRMISKLQRLEFSIIKIKSKIQKKLVEKIRLKSKLQKRLVEKFKVSAGITPEFRLDLWLLNQLEESHEGRPDLVKTKTSQIADDVSDNLERELKKFARQFSRKLIAGDNIFNIRSEFDKDIDDLIQVSVQRSYTAGLDYVGKVRDGEQPMIQQDLVNIKNISDELRDRFWGMLSQFEPKKSKEFDFTVILNMITALSSDMMTKSLYQSTISGAVQVQQDPEQPDILTEFVTRRDFRVCPICEPLDGLMFKLGDPNQPNIPDDTHPRCRCRYLIHRPDGTVVG
jgi:hypothetical protein